MSVEDAKIAANMWFQMSYNKYIQRKLNNLKTFFREQYGLKQMNQKLIKKLMKSIKN